MALYKLAILRNDFRIAKYNVRFVGYNLTILTTFVLAILPFFLRIVRYKLKIVSFAMKKMIYIRILIFSIFLSLQFWIYNTQVLKLELWDIDSQFWEKKLALRVHLSQFCLKFSELHI